MRSLATTLAVLLVASPLLAQDAPDDEAAQAKEEARLMKKARRLADDDDKKGALAAFKSVADLASQRKHAANEIAALTEALPLATDDAEEEASLLSRLEGVEFREGEYASAARHCERLAELKPDDSNVMNSLGSSLHKAGRDEESIKAYERCLELDPQSAIARMSLGRVSRLAGKAKKALHAHEKLVERAQGGTLDAGGWYIGFESKKQKAQSKGQDFNTAGQLKALLELEVAVDHACLDELDEAEKIVERTKKNAAETDFAPALEEAIDDLERLLELRPAHFQLRYVLALLYEAKGDDESKKAELEKVVAAEKALRPFAKKARERLEALEGEKPAEKPAEKPPAGK